MRRIRLAATTFLSTLVLAASGALPAAAQADPLGTAGLGRPYLHVFIAYALAIVLIGGWVISIARRLRRIEGRLPEAE